MFRSKCLSSFNRQSGRMIELSSSFSILLFWYFCLCEGQLCLQGWLFLPLCLWGAQDGAGETHTEWETGIILGWGALLRWIYRPLSLSFQVCFVTNMEHTHLVKGYYVCSWKWKSKQISWNCMAACLQELNVKATPHTHLLPLWLSSWSNYNISDHLTLTPRVCRDTVCF